MSSKNHLKPVFITGHPRSGTSLLYRTLLKHSSFEPKELCMEETKIFRYPLLALHSHSESGSLQEYMLNDEELFDQYLRAIQTEKKWQKLLKVLRLPFIILNDHSAWKLSKNPSVIRTYFEYALKARGCKRIVEKTPNHLLIHKRITDTFPKASILIISRHPIDVYSSYRKRFREHPEMNWLDLSVRDFTEQYREYSDITEELRSSPQVYLFKYEDFVHSPESSFRKICDFLEEPYEEAPIREDEPSLKIEGVNPNLSKKIREKTKQWADYVSREEAQLIENTLKDVMNRYNYDSVLKES
ncbi:MAG: sulfotransferase [Balneolaceae bacterium]|nr:sulfotransferase [Balneolaceae bacterium]